MLPDEIWEEIFKFVDVLDLVKLQGVSKHWRELITGVIERECKWYKKCMEVVPEDTWSPILEHHTHPEICCDDFHRSKKHSEIWSSLYRSWIGWTTLAERNSSTESIVIFNEEKRDFLEYGYADDDWTFGISCLDAKGSTIVVGTGSEGRVIFYDISNFHGEPIFEAHHEFTIATVSLGRVDGDVIAVANSMKGQSKLQFWNLRTKTPTVRIITSNSSLDTWRFVSASYDYCQMIEDHTQVEDDESYDSSHEEYYVVRIERIGSESDSSSHIHEYLESHGEIAATCFDRRNMSWMIVHNVGDTYYRFFTKDTKDLYPRGKMFDIYGIVDTCNFSAFKIFKPGVIAYVDEGFCTEFGFLIRDDEWKRYYVERDLGLQYKLRSILYHVGVLILGFTLGYILIVDVKNVDGLFKLDLKTMRNKLIKLDNDHRLIKNLNVTEYNSHQYLVAATDQKVYLVKFD